MTSDAAELEMLDRLGRGDRDAFGQLVARYQSVVCGVAYSIVGDVARSEDVAQEAFLAAWKQRGELRDVRRFKAWLCGITRNLASLAVRRERKTESLDLRNQPVAAQITSEERAVSREEQTLVWKVLESLPEAYREPLVLFYREEASIARVAEALELSEDAVKQRLARGREMLRGEVAATIESALRRSAPGATFVLSVMAAVQGLGAASASAATIGAAGKSAVPLVAAVKTGLFGALFGSLIGLLGAGIGTWVSWQSARYPRERQLIRRAVFIFAIGLAVFSAPFLAMLLGWKPILHGTGAYLVGYLLWMGGFSSALGIWIWRFVHSYRRIVAEETARGAPQLPQSPLQRRLSGWEGRRWTSRRRFLGLPLVQVNVSDPSASAGDLLAPRVARGWIAIGDRAHGVVLAVGNIAVGAIALGGVSVGGVAFGGLSVGLLACGGVAVGGVPIGGVAFGVAAIGGLAVGWIALGGAAIAWNAAKGGVAIANNFALGGASLAHHANDDAAASYFSDSLFFTVVEPLLLKTHRAQEQGWTQFTVIAAVIGSVAVFCLMTFRRKRRDRENVTMTRGTKIGVIGAGVVFGGVVLVGVGLTAQYLWFNVLRPATPKESLTVRLDDAGPYLVLSSVRATTDYAKGIEEARNLHPGSQHLSFDPQDLAPVLKALQEQQPRYALVFLLPDELDVNFAWQWLTMASRIDDDPFVDVRTGFITGATPEAADSFVHRIAEAVAGRIRLPGALIDNLGPPEQGDQQYFNTFNGAMMLPTAMGERLTMRSIAHGKGGFTDERLASMDGAGIVHLGGHGHPDRIDDGLTALQVSQLELSPCVVFNGACYTGVTHRWFEPWHRKDRQKSIASADSFCLNLLQKDVLGYLAAVHPDHGMPVYQEMEFLACHGGSLGEVIKSTYDGVVVGAGGKLPTFERLTEDSDFASRTPAEIMLKGTAARILLGDPALIVCEAFVPKPFSLITVEDGKSLRITATVTNADLKSTFTDTYHNDLNPQAPFNDRVSVVVELPAGWDSIGSVEVGAAKASGVTLPNRLVGYAVEQDHGRHRLHVQVDVPAKGFQPSALRVAGATVELVVMRPEPQNASTTKDMK